MEFQKVLGICLLSFLSATLVVLISRSVDSQAARRLEPQLSRIADELEALRVAGGLAAMPVATSAELNVSDGVIVYYFYSNTRCPTCRAIETQAEEAVRENFVRQLADGSLIWKTLNYEEDRNVELAGKFEIAMPVVVIARFEDAEMVHWQRLDQVWGLVGDKPAFANMICESIRGELKEGPQEQGDRENDTIDAIPVPDSAGIPLPTS